MGANKVLQPAQSVRLRASIMLVILLLVTTQIIHCQISASEYLKQKRIFFI